MNYFIVGWAAGAVLVPGSWLAAFSFGLLNLTLSFRGRKTP